MEWILKNFIYSEERGRPYLMSWIHSHVGGAECFFSSVDVHTQHTLAKFHEAVIGMVIQLNENDEIAHHDFYEMSRQGLRHVENCSRKENCNTRQQHDSCYNTNLYKSARDKVMLHDDVGLRVQNFMLPMVNNKKQDQTLPTEIDFPTVGQTKSPSPAIPRGQILQDKFPALGGATRLPIPQAVAQTDEVTFQPQAAGKVF